MQVLQTRIDSFKKPKRVKNPNKPSSTTTLRWPHPLDFKANPETLADAGFFYDPSYEDPDNVTCYFCDKELGGWEADDDPHAIHWEKCGQTCCWAIVRCGLPNDMDKSGRFVFTDKTRVPTHKLMEKARLDTFNVGNGWIHDHVKNHCANSKMMARAGFVYTPLQSDDDLVTCLYCDTSLCGWDANDDPMEEHRRRENKSAFSCPFVSASVSGPAPTTTKATAKTPRKGRSTSHARKSSTKTPKSKTRSTSKSSLKNVAEVDEDREAPLDAEPTVKNKTRSRSKSVARSEPEQTDAEGEIQKKSLRSRSKTKVVEDSEDVPRRPTKVKALEDDEVPPKPSRTRSKTASKSKSKATPEPLEEAEHETATAIMDEYIPPPSSPLAALSRQVDAHVPLDPVNHRSTEISTKDKSAVKGKPNSQYGDPVVKQKTAGTTTGQVILQPQSEHEVGIVFPQSRKPKRSLEVEVVQPKPSVPAELPIVDVDVNMESETDNHVCPAPSTPQPQTPPKDLSLHMVSTSIMVEPPLMPALSKLPFTPLHALSEVELDMTVEEWIRYQMDVEYDKFRRDGERELQRFRNQAEEVRKAIEAL